MGSDGVVRIILCVALAVIGVTTRRRLRLRRRPRPARRPRHRVVARRAAHRPTDRRRRGARSPRTSAGCCSARCSPPCSLNAGPIATTILADPDQKTEVTAFAYGVLMARIPLFLFQAVQAALLPRLSRLAARDELGEFRAGLKRLLMVVLGRRRRRHDRRARARAVRHQDVLRRRPHRPDAGDAGPRQRLLHGRPLAGPGVIALKGHASSRSGWSIGVVVFLLATWLSQRRPVPAGRDRPAGVVGRRRWSRSPSSCATAWPSASSPTPTR